MATIACVLFPDFTQLDLTGPYEVFHRMPDAVVHLVAASEDPVESEGGLAIVPALTFDELSLCDVLFVPGGPGVNEAMLDEALIAFIQSRAARASWVTSACTGSLILGAAGLLAGFEATTHWASIEFLQAFGAWPKRERVVVSGNRITGAGVTAGIDVALRLVEELHGARVAEEIRVAIEYGSGETSPEVRDAVERKLSKRKIERGRAVEEAARKLSS
ncbi:MAG TPA: DJ-1/PfpI family protein [Thermoanaerobaculia bacterium]